MWLYFSKILLGHSLLTPELDQQRALFTEMALLYYDRLTEGSGPLWGTVMRVAEQEGGNQQQVNSPGLAGALQATLTKGAKEAGTGQENGRSRKREY